MAIGDITERKAVIRAMEEYDRIGPERFYSKYGFGRALKFLVLHKGKQYDSKAILAVAHRYQFGKPMKNTFSGGIKKVVPVLRRLGFEVVTKNLAELSVKAPEEVPADLWEGARTQVYVNSFERNLQARTKCIEVHGSHCAVCGFSFEAAYGAAFSGFIHVHHRVALAKIGRRYKIDPANDLIPVCPNCHAVLHHGGVHRTVDEVKVLVSRGR